MLCKSSYSGGLWYISDEKILQFSCIQLGRQCLKVCPQDWKPMCIGIKINEIQETPIYKHRDSIEIHERVRKITLLFGPVWSNHDRSDNIHCQWYP